MANETKTTYISVDKQDLERLMASWNETLIEATDRIRNEEEALPVHSARVRPVIKRLATLVQTWEQLDDEERREEEEAAKAKEKEAAKAREKAEAAAMRNVAQRGITTEVKAV